MPNIAELLEMKTQSLGNYAHHIASSMGGEVSEWDGGVLCNARHPAEYRNMAVLFRRLSPPECMELAERAVEFFAGSDRWVLSSVYPQLSAIADFFCQIETTPIMWRPSGAELVLPQPSDLSCREIETDAEMTACERVREESYGRRYAGPGGGYLDARVLGQGFRCWLGSNDGVAVSTGSVFTSNGVALIRSVATLPSFRGRRYGGFITAHLVNQSTGIPMLDSTLDAQPLYVRMGFETIGTMRFWKLK